MHRAIPALKIAGRGAARGVGVLVVIYAVVITLSLITGITLEIPGILEAVGSTTNGASSVEVQGHPSTLPIAAAIGAVIALLWAPRRRMRLDQTEEAAA